MADSKREENIDFQMSDKDIEEIAKTKSETVPSVQYFGKTAFTIENAPVPKSVHDAIGIEKTITIKMTSKLSSPEEVEGSES